MEDRRPGKPWSRRLLAAAGGRYGPTVGAGQTTSGRPSSRQSRTTVRRPTKGDQIPVACIAQQQPYSTLTHALSLRRATPTMRAR